MQLSPQRTSHACARSEKLKSCPGFMRQNQGRRSSNALSPMSPWANPLNRAVSPVNLKGFLMTSSSSPRKRAIATSDTTIGSTRYNLYKQAYSRINDATKQGFFLEAITIIESLISDRLESRLTFLKKHDV